MPPKDTLGNRVRVVRERLGITQVDLAREVGISRQALISVEKGRMNPSVVVSLKVARILREPVDYLFFIDGREGEAPEPEERAAKAAKAPKAPKASRAAAPAPVVEPAPVPEPEPVANEEPHIVLDPDAVHEPDPYYDDEVDEEAFVELEAAPEHEEVPARHAVPVSAEPEAVKPGDAGKGDDTDDAQLSLFE